MRCEDGCGLPQSWETEAGTRCAVPTGHRCIGTRAVNLFLRLEASARAPGWSRLLSPLRTA